MKEDDFIIQNDKPPLRDGKDEMNLIEHPFALLSLGADDRKVIEVEWEAQHSGRLVRCIWRVAGDAELGLPRPIDERLYLVLMELSRESGWLQQVLFRRTDLMRRMGMTRTASSYAELRESFTRLAGVSIRADRSFYNKKTKKYDTLKIFNLIEQVTIAEEPTRAMASDAQPLSSFTWSEVMWQSLKDGNIKTLDMDFALSLQLPLSLRLYRYLDKKRFDGKGKFVIGLRLLCDVHLGMKPAKYDSKYIERLKNAHEELIATGFLADVKVGKAKPKNKGGKGEAQLTYFFPRVAAIEPPQPGKASNTPADAPAVQSAAASALPPKYLAACEAAYASLPAASRAIIDREASESGADYRDLVWKYHNQDVGRELKPTRRNIR